MKAPKTALILTVPQFGVFDFQLHLHCLKTIVFFVIAPGFQKTLKKQIFCHVEHEISG